MRRSRLAGVALAVVSASGYGAMPIFVRVAYNDGASPLTVLFLRFTIAAALMLALMAARRTPFPGGRALVGLILLGVVGYVAQSLAYYMAISFAPVSLVALLLNLAPVLVTAGSFVFFREPVTPARLGALALAAGGAGLMIASSGISFSGAPGQTSLGVLLGFPAAFLSAGYVLSGSRLLRSVPSLPASAVIITATGAGYTALAAAQGFRFPAQPGGWAAVIALATVSTVMAIATFLAGMQRIGPTNAATIGVLEPVIAVILSTIVLGEHLGLLQAAGGALVLSAVIIVTRSA